MSTKVQKSKGLNVRQKAFVQAYTDQSNGTFGNATKAYKKAYPEASENTAGANGSLLLKNTRIQENIKETFDKVGFTDQVACEILAEIAHGNDRREQKRYSVNRGKRKLVEVVELTSTPTQRIDAIETRAKLTGHYKRIEIAGDIAREREYKALRSKYLDK